MNCRDFDSVVFPVARKRLLDVTARELALSHTEVCARCGNRLAEERALFDAVHSIMAELSTTEAPANVEAALLVVFREHVATTRTPTVATFPIRTAGRRIWRIAAAAAAILILGMALFWQRSSAPAAREEVVVAPEPSIDSQPSGIHKVIPESKEPPRRLARAHRQKRPSNSSDVEVATEFFPLLEGLDLDSLEHGQIVRIELPGSALVAVGLAGGGESSSEPVEAEVVLGQDGLARAIRFVR